jgi:DNA (cytosine-5)-methyltransferase 1
MPTVIDLFAGAGGLSLGAARAGFNVAAAVELDSFALETHNKNFPRTIHIPRDVAGLSGDELLRFAGVLPGGLDGLIGGPPCQGFSSIGQQRMDDTRNDLFSHFFRLVQETRPKFFLAENVPGILNEKYDGIRTAAFNLVGNNYNLLDPVIVKASDYGAPTIRTRVFFIGYDPHHMNDITPNDFSPPIDAESTKVKIALSGLPINISPHWQTEFSGWREIGTTEESRFFDRIVNNVPNGLGDQRSLDLYFGKRMVSGCMGTRHSKEVEDRYKSLDYGQQDRISRSVRLDPEGFCPTLRAGTARDRGSYQAVRPIHYEKPRVVTPREAARLQGFPDWFVFHSTKWHSFRQIGNSVSPIVSERILSVLNGNLQ